MCTSPLATPLQEGFEKVFAAAEAATAAIEVGRWVGRGLKAQSRTTLKHMANMQPSITCCGVVLLLVPALLHTRTPRNSTHTWTLAPTPGKHSGRCCCLILRFFFHTTRQTTTQTSYTNTQEARPLLSQSIKLVEEVTPLLRELREGGLVANVEALTATAAAAAADIQKLQVGARVVLS